MDKLINKSNNINKSVENCLNCLLQSDFDTNYKLKKQFIENYTAWLLHYFNLDFCLINELSKDSENAGSSNSRDMRISYKTTNLNKKNLNDFLNTLAHEIKHISDFDYRQNQAILGALHHEKEPVINGAIWARVDKMVNLKSDTKRRKYYLSEGEKEAYTQASFYVFLFLKQLMHINKDTIMQEKLKKLYQQETEYITLQTTIFEQYFKYNEWLKKLDKKDNKKILKAQLTLLKTLLIDREYNKNHKEDFDENLTTFGYLLFAYPNKRIEFLLKLSIDKFSFDEQRDILYYVSSTNLKVFSESQINRLISLFNLSLLGDVEPRTLCERVLALNGTSTTKKIIKILQNSAKFRFTPYLEEVINKYDNINFYGIKNISNKEIRSKTLRAFIHINNFKLNEQTISYLNKVSRENFSCYNEKENTSNQKDNLEK